MRNVDEPLAEFRPSLLRLLARPILVAIVMAVLVASIPSVSPGSWPLIALLVFSIFFIVEALYYTPPDPSRYLIVISDQAISGPTSKQNRITLSVDKIDVVKSQARRRWYQSIYNIRWIQANDSEKILVYCDAYPKDAFDQMLKIISDLQNDRVRREQNVE
jgi:hypothetical protein